MTVDTAVSVTRQHLEEMKTSITYPIKFVTCDGSLVTVRQQFEDILRLDPPIHCCYMLR